VREVLAFPLGEIYPRGRGGTSSNKEREKMNSKEVIKYLEIVMASFDPKTAPRFDKDKIEGERNKAREALTVAINNLKVGA